MSRIGRRVRAAVNPVSTAATGWWCHSALRHVLTGYGPTARQRRFIRHGMIQGADSGRPPSRCGRVRQRSTSCLPETTTKCEKHSNASDLPYHTTDAC